MIFAAFDLDGTLVNSHNLISLALAEKGYMIAPESNEYNFKFIEGHSPPEDFQWDLFYYRLFTERFSEVGPIDEYVYDFLKNVYGSGSEPLRIITARSDGALMHYCTSELLKRLFPEIDFSIDVVSSGKDKGRYMFGADIIFEDRRKTALDMSNDGFIVFLRKAQYNKLPDGVGVHISEVSDYREINAGEIITFDSWKQMNDYGIGNLLRPF